MGRSGMKSKSGLSLSEVLVILVVVGVVAAVLFPVFARTHCPPGRSTCQSNLKQIGNAIKMYLSDWADTYPTNRAYVHGKTLGPTAACVKLSGSEPLRGTNEPPKFSHGINWVEGLYSYVETVTKRDDPMTTWRCPEASDRAYPDGSDTAATTYVFNRNLVEKREGIILSAANLLMVREVDRLMDAELRPTNDTTGSSKKTPFEPFLCSWNRAGRMNVELHGEGSHILFADGHVKLFHWSSMPDVSDITKGSSWDPNTRQWYNFYYANPQTPEQKTRNMTIAITP